MPRTCAFRRGSDMRGHAQTRVCVHGAVQCRWGSNQQGRASTCTSGHSAKIIPMQQAELESKQLAPPPLSPEQHDPCGHYRPDGAASGQRRSNTMVSGRYDHATTWERANELVRCTGLRAGDTFDAFHSYNNTNTICLMKNQTS